MKRVTVSDNIFRIQYKLIQNLFKITFGNVLGMFLGSQASALASHLLASESAPVDTNLPSAKFAVDPSIPKDPSLGDITANSGGSIERSTRDDLFSVRWSIFFGTEEGDSEVVSDVKRKLFLEGDGSILSNEKWVGTGVISSLDCGVILLLSIKWFFSVGDTEEGWFSGFVFWEETLDGEDNEEWVCVLVGIISDSSTTIDSIFWYLSLWVWEVGDRSWDDNFESGWQASSAFFSGGSTKIAASWFSRLFSLSSLALVSTFFCAVKELKPTPPRLCVEPLLMAFNNDWRLLAFWRGKLAKEEERVLAFGWWLADDELVDESVSDPLAWDNKDTLFKVEAE